MHLLLNRIFLKIDTDRVTLQGSKVADSLYNLKSLVKSGPYNCDKNKMKLKISVGSDADAKAIRHGEEGAAPDSHLWS